MKQQDNVLQLSLSTLAWPSHSSHVPPLHLIDFHFIFVHTIYSLYQIQDLLFSALLAGVFNVMAYTV